MYNAVAIYSSCNIDLLQFRVEIFAGLQGGSQHCSLWVDSHVFLRPAEELDLRLTESLQQLRECRSGGGLGVPATEDQGMHYYYVYSCEVYAQYLLSSHKGYTVT